MSFKKKVITIDEEGLKRAEAIAEEKITLLQSAMKEAEKHIHIDDFKAFSKDFIAYTTKKIIDKSVLDENFKVKNLVGGDNSKHKETS